LQIPGLEKARELLTAKFSWLRELEKGVQKKGLGERRDIGITGTDEDST
jgi:hypothetical protein